MKIILSVIALIPYVFGDVSHILPHEQQLETTTTPQPPPKPYAFGYAAGRFPGHIDRTHTEISDGSGIVKGSYSYVDPRFRIRTVDYIADKQGFHPILNTPQKPLPDDSPIVAAAKDRHLHLYAQIAHEHQQGVVPLVVLPRKSYSVAQAEAKHYDLYQKIAAQHAQIAAERQAEAEAARATAIPDPGYVEGVVPDQY